jgi:hypothetical protein
MNWHGWAVISIGLTWLISGSVSAIPIEQPEDHAIAVSGSVITRSYEPERGRPEQPKDRSSHSVNAPDYYIGFCVSRTVRLAGVSAQATDLPFYLTNFIGFDADTTVREAVS